MKQKIGLNILVLENSEEIQEEPSENADTIVTYIGISEIPDINVVGNDEDQESERIEEISTNFVGTGETYNRKTTIVDIYFVEKTVMIIDLDPEPNSMAECKQRLDWIK
jgi:hypothetical protein